MENVDKTSVVIVFPYMPLGKGLAIPLFYYDLNLFLHELQ